MENQDMEQVTNMLSQAIEQNATDTPHLSIDPETQRPSVLGDPTKMPERKGDYELTFVYSEDEVSEYDRTKMVYDEKNHLYGAKVKFTDKRIKPIYRGQVLVLLTDIMSAFGALEEDGYSSDIQAMMVSREVLAKSEAIAELVHLVVGIPKDQAERLTPEGAIGFVRQLLENEPNIMAESSNFLSSSVGN